MKNLKTFILSSVVSMSEPLVIMWLCQSLLEQEEYRKVLVVTKVFVLFFALSLPIVSASFYAKISSAKGTPTLLRSVLLFSLIVSAITREWVYLLIPLNVLGSLLREYESERCIKEDKAKEHLIISLIRTVVTVLSAIVLLSLSANWVSAVLPYTIQSVAFILLAFLFRKSILTNFLKYEKGDFKYFIHKCKLSTKDIGVRLAYNFAEILLFRKGQVLTISSYVILNRLFGLVSGVLSLVDNRIKHNIVSQHKDYKPVVAIADIAVAIYIIASVLLLIYYWSIFPMILVVTTSIYQLIRIRSASTEHTLLSTGNYTETVVGTSIETVPILGINYIHPDPVVYQTLLVVLAYMKLHYYRVRLNKIKALQTNR